MGLDQKRKEKIVPRYRPHQVEIPKNEPNKVFNESFLEHHNIATLKLKTNQNEKKDGDTDDG